MQYWKKTKTDKYRYGRLGVSGFVAGYAKNSGKNNMIANLLPQLISHKHS